MSGRGGIRSAAVLSVAARLATLFTGAALVAAHPLAAQDVGSGVLLQTFSFGDPQATGIDRFELFVVPVAAAVPLGPGVAVSASTAWARGRVTGAGGNEATLDGPTDTDVSVSWAPLPWLVVRADATIPTGTSALTIEEGIVAGVAASQLFPVAVQTWGGGSAIGGTLGVARQVGAWGIGVAGGFLMSRTFEPLPGTSIGYDPGDLLHIRVAVDRDIGGTSSFALVLSAQDFEDDRVLDTNLFQVGTRLQGVASVAFPVAARSSARVFLGAEYRSEGAVLADLVPGVIDTPTQLLFHAGGNGRVPLGRRTALLPRAELRLLRTGDGLSQGWLGAGGVTLDWRVTGTSVGPRLVVAPTARLMGGSVVVEEGSRSGFVGWEAGLTLRFEGGR